MSTATICQELKPICRLPRVDYEVMNDRAATDMPREAKEATCGHAPHYAHGMCKVCYYKTNYDRTDADQKYEQSEAGKARMQRFNTSEERKAYRREWTRKKRAAKKAAKAAQAAQSEAKQVKAAAAKVKSRKRKPKGASE